VYHEYVVGRTTFGFRFFPGLLVFLGFVGGAVAQPSVQDSNSNTVSNACAPSPESFLAQRLTFWQGRLGVADWNIAITMSHPSDLKPKTLGNIHWNADTKTAVIRVLASSDYTLACPEMLADMEFTVVHELVHLVLSSLPRSQASRSEEEHAVNQLTDALLKLERRK